jgi:hypothetical protein
MATSEEIFGTPAHAAKVRNELCERFGMVPDPKDVELVAAAIAASENVNKRGSAC